MKRRDPVTYYSWLLFFPAFILLVFGSFLCLQTRPDVIRSNGVQMTGVVLEKYWTSSGSGENNKSYGVKVEASDNHVFKGGVSSRSYEFFSKGETVRVYKYKDQYYVDEHDSLSYISPLYFIIPGILVLLCALFFKKIVEGIKGYVRSWGSWRGVSSSPLPQRVAADDPPGTRAGLPEEPVFVQSVSVSTIENKTLYFKPGRVEFRASRAFIWFCLVMVAVAVGVWFLPFRVTTSTRLYLHQLIAIGIAWGGFCTLIPYFLIKMLGTSIVFDLRKKKIQVYKKKKRIRAIDFSDLKCLQLCCLIDSSYMAYQLNLCFVSGERYVMVTSIKKSALRKMGKKLARTLEKDFVDCSDAAYERESSDYR